MTLLGGTEAAAAPARSGAAGSGPAAAHFRAREDIFAVDTETGKSYDVLRAQLIRHLGPVIVVQNDYRGGLYTLIHNGEQESLHPVSDIFRLAKSVAHTPLGIYTVIAPYLDHRIPNLPSSAHLDRHDLDMVAFGGPGADGWTGPLQAFGATLATARQQLAPARMPPELTAACAQILNAAVEFIDGSVRRGHVDLRSFEQFSGGLNDAIGVTLTYAAQAQIEGVENLMKRWRKRIGAADWPGLYIVVMSIWTTSFLNQNSIILKPLMDPAKADSHLIDLATAQVPANPVFVALDNLARIVQDNVAAESVFPVDQRMADALKGPEDLLAPAILQQLACPYRGGAAARKAAGSALAPGVLRSGGSRPVAHPGCSGPPDDHPGAAYGGPRKEG